MIVRSISWLFAATVLAASAEAQVLRGDVQEWTINGETREAIVVLPRPSETPAPVIFAFHGHGGTMRNFARKNFGRDWPEAIVVYPQGLPTATPRDPEGKKPGWQVRPGGNGDRDLKLFDAVLKTLRESGKVDESRIYATGHSNGGAFTYLLWTQRGKELAAVAPSSAPGALLLATAKDLTALPVLHLAGKGDAIVPFAAQQSVMAECRQRLGCSGEGKPWASAGPLVGTQYESKGKTPFVSLIHDGGHEFPDEAPELIVKFFKEHTKPPAVGEAKHFSAE